MSATMTTHPKETPGMLHALEALRSPVNIALAVSGGAVSLLLLLGAMSMLAHNYSKALIAFVVLGACLAWLTGECAVTTRRLQVSHASAQSGFPAAITSGFFAAIKVLLSMLLLLAGLLVLMLVAGLLFLITQIPGIGPVLNVVIFPVIALIVGVAIYTLLFIALPLACVSASDGRSVFGTVATVMAAVRSRLFDIVLRGVLVWLLALLVAFLASSIVSIGVGATGVIQSTVHLSSSSGYSHAAGYGRLGGYGAMVGGYGGMLGGMSALLAPLMAGGAASIVLYLLAASLGIVVYASGWVTAFEECVRELDPTAMEAQMRAQAERMQRGAREAQTRAAHMAGNRGEKVEAQTPGTETPPDRRPD